MDPGGRRLTTGSGPLRYPVIGLDGGVQYDVQVRAVNSVGRGPWSATATGVTELRSNAPPVFTATRSIPENATEGHSVGAPFAATDPDGDAVSYALSGADSGSFAVGRTSGQITLAAGVVLDHEAKASYAVTVTATDGGGLSASIAVTINVTKVDEAGPSAESCVQPIDVDGAAVSGAWTGDCPSANLPGSNARYYTFTLSAQREVTITLESDGADTYLILLSGAGTEGSVLHYNENDGGTTRSRIQETLDAGTYTIEANTLDAGATSGFTLSVETVEEPEQPGSPGPRPVPPPDTGCVETVAEDGSVNGEWSSACQSENRSGSYAQYYSFTLAQSSEVTITLERTSGDADTFLNLLSGAGTDGSVLHFNDDDGGTTRSRIQETLEAGTYTVEATTYAAGQTGSFTLTVSGLGSTTTTDSCLENLSRDGSVTGQWASGCESGTVSKDGSGDYPHARYYSFTLTQNSEVTITLESHDSDTLLYLREGDDTRSGAILYEDDDSPDETRSQIRETLPAATYTIEATTYGAEQTGSFTLTVSGL